MFCQKHEFYVIDVMYVCICYVRFSWFVISLFVYVAILVDDSLLKEIKIVSIGQFRPEKDHPLQLKSMYHLRQLVSEETWDKVSN